MQFNSVLIQKIPTPAVSFPLSFLFLLMLSAIILSIPVALASQDEAYGTVTNVVDGNTFDVTIEKADPRISYSVERIRLADVKSPEIETLQGPAARDFTFAVLINKRVYLDIDDLSGSGSGRDIHGSLICVAYLTGFYGQPLVSPNFNRLLVDAGHAKLENSANNEFDPQDWWSEEVTPSVAKPLPDLQESPQENLQQSSQKDTQNDPKNGTPTDLKNNTESDLKNDLQKNILPKLQEYAEKELDRAAEEGWNWLKGQIKV
jgi:endonuclease YncB( thermonuclease family)